MKIMSSQHLLAQPVVTACGHVEEGPSADKLRLGISGIVTWKVKKLHNGINEKAKCEIMKSTL